MTMFGWIAHTFEPVRRRVRDADDLPRTQGVWGTLSDDQKGLVRTGFDGNETFGDPEFALDNEAA